MVADLWRAILYFLANYLSGDNTLMNSISRGFTLIELMVVVAIIGILSAIAVPAYQDYVARAKIVEALAWLSSAKTGIAAHFADDGNWPSYLEEIGIADGAVSDYIANVELGDESELGGTDDFVSAPTTPL